MEEKRILVIEDEVIVAYDLKEFLEGQGYSVQLALDVPTAIDTIKSFQPFHAGGCSTGNRCP